MDCQLVVKHVCTMPHDAHMFHNCKVAASVPSDCLKPGARPIVAPCPGKIHCNSYNKWSSDFT
jgi:hypothetical protein